MVVALVAARTEAGRDFIARQIAEAVQGGLADGWTLDVPELDWSVDGRLHLDNVVLRAPDDHVVLGIRHLALDLDWPSSPGVQISTARIDGVDVHLTADDDGVLDLVRAFGGPSPSDPNAQPFSGLPFAVHIEDLGLRDTRVQLDTPSGTALALSALDLRAGVHMAPNSPAVRVPGLQLSGMMLRPEAMPLRVEGDVLWTGDGLELPDATVQLHDSTVRLAGSLSELSDGGVLDLTLNAEPLDIDLVRVFTGVKMGGTYEGTVYGRGPLGALELWGRLDGTRGTEGGLILQKGSFLCLPTEDGRHHEACRGETFERPVGEKAPLAWKAHFDADQFALEQLFPAITGSIVIDGDLKGRGYGVGWPEGMTIEDVEWREGKEIDVYGLRIRSVGGDIAIRDGVLHISEADLEGVAGRVQGGGTLDFRDGHLALDVSGPLEPEMLVDVGLEDVGGRGTYTAVVTGNIYEDGVPIDVRGRAHIEPFSFTEDVKIGTVDGTFAATVRHGHTHVGVDLVGTAGSAWGSEFDEIAVPDLQVDYGAGKLLVTGTASTPKLTYTEYATFYDVVAPFTWSRESSEVDPVLTADVAVGNQEIAGLIGNNGTAVVRLEGSALEADVQLRWDDDPFIIAPDLTLDLSTLRLEIPELLLAPSFRQRWRTEEPISLYLNGAGVRDAVVNIRSDYGHVRIFGTVGTEGPLDGKIRANNFDLDVLAELFPDTLDGLDGDLDLVVDMSGTGADPVITGTMDADELFLPDVMRWADLEGEFKIRDEQLTLDLGLGALGDDIFDIVGSVPVVDDLSRFGADPNGNADARVVVLPGRLARIGQLVPELELPSGTISGVLAVRGNVLDPDLDLRGVTELDVDRLDVPARVEFDIKRDEGTLTASVDTYEGLRRAALIDGVATTRLSEVVGSLLAGNGMPEGDPLQLVVDDLDVWVQEISVSMSTVLELTGLDAAVRGRVGGGMHITGSPERPEVDLDLDLVGQARKQPFEAIIDLDSTETGYDIDLELGYSGDGWLAVVGHVPLQIDLTKAVEDWGVGDWDLAVNGTGMPLGIASAVVDGLQPYTGRLSSRGHVRGPWAAPRPDLTLTAVGVRAAYRPLGIEFQNGALRANVHAGEGDGIPWGVSVRELSATTKPINRSTTDLEAITRLDRSALDVTAELRFDGTTMLDVDGEVALTRAWLSGNDGAMLRADTSARTRPLRVSGTWPELRVDGALTVDRGDLEFNTANLFAERASLLDRSITVHRGVGALEAPDYDESSVLDDMVIDVDVDFGRATQMRLLVPVFDDLGALGASVTRADVEARLGGELDVVMDHGALSVGGEVRLLSGRLSLLGSRFDLEDSQITFLGSAYDDPRLDIRGVMEVTGGQVLVRVHNTAQDPRLELSSPEFGDSAEDLLAILVTGRSPAELGAQEGAAAIEVVSGLLVQSVLGGGQLGQIEIAGDGTVTIGLPVARNFQVWATADPIPSLNESQFTVRGELSVLPRFVIDGFWGDRGWGGSLFWETRFDHVFPGRQPEEPTAKEEEPVAKPVEEVLAEPIEEEVPVAPTEQEEPAEVPEDSSPQLSGSRVEKPTKKSIRLARKRSRQLRREARKR